MINPRDLRIGNLFNSDEPTKVEAWMLLEESKIVFKPIHITEEWLLKFGFVIDRNGYYDSEGGKQGLSFAVTQDGGFLPCWQDRVLNPNKILKYVHQLQNLYFELTGEELTIKKA